jgi:hypothetical protein
MLTLEGSGDARGRFVIGQIETGNGAASPTPPMLTLGRNLLPSWTPHVFGAEERASLTQEAGALVLSCHPGEQPAGLFVVEDAVLPPIAGLELEVAARGSAGFVIAAADESARRRDAPLPLMTLSGAGEPATARAPVSPALDRHSRIAWSLLCPRHGGAITLTRFSLQGQGARAGSAVPGRSAWAWQPELWRDTPGALIERLGALHIDRVYITVPLSNDEEVTDATALRAFVDAAAQHGLRVWAVEGDPYAVLPAGRATFRKRAAALAAYNRVQRPNARLVGVQYDIEPYLVPGFALDPDRFTGAYLDTLATLGAAVEMPVEAAIPFWFPFEKWGARLAEVVGGIAVMDYRTAPDDIQRFAMPALAWGTAHQRSVRIGLELGPLGSEERLRFHHAATGQLWRVAVGADHALLLLRTPAKNPAGETYVAIDRHEVLGSSQSFSGSEHSLDSLLPALIQNFAPWPAYAGIALHGLF